MRKIGTLVLVLNMTASLFAQVENPVKWSFEQKKVRDGEFELIFRATIESGWHMYGLNIPSGPIPTSFKFEGNKGYEFLGKLTSGNKPLIKKDPFFNVNVELFERSAVFSRSVKVISETPVKVK